MNEIRERKNHLYINKNDSFSISPHLTDLAFYSLSLSLSFFVLSSAYIYIYIYITSRPSSFQPNGLLEENHHNTLQKSLHLFQPAAAKGSKEVSTRPRDQSHGSARGSHGMWLRRCSSYVVYSRQVQIHKLFNLTLINQNSHCTN